MTDKRIGRKDIMPGVIYQGHMASGNVVITTGLAANRPTKGTNTCLAYFATDSHVLSVWTGSAWKATTLT